MFRSRTAIRKTALFLLIPCVLVLGSCENAGSLAGGGDRSDYSVARTALENGNYTLAIQRYERLIASAGPEAGRLQLEYAHSLLRANRYSEAEAEASRLVALQRGPISGSALAVRGTARHEAARMILNSGGDRANAGALLQSAQADLRQFLSAHSELESGGTMRARLELIASDLASLG